MRSLFKRSSTALSNASSVTSLGGNGDGGDGNSSGGGGRGGSSKALNTNPRKLLLKRRWADLLDAISTPRGRKYVTSWEDSFSGHLFLHEVVSYDPPAEVVSRFIELYPPALCHRTLGGCLPLHCAVMYGASVEVVKVLVEATDDEAILAEALAGADDYGTDSTDFSAPSVGDAEGRTPLHLAVTKAVRAFDDSEDSPKAKKKNTKRGRAGAAAEEDDRAETEKERARALAVMAVVCSVTPLDVVFERRDLGHRRETPVKAASSCEAVRVALEGAIKKRRTEEDEEKIQRRSRLTRKSTARVAIHSSSIISKRGSKVTKARELDEDQADDVEEDSSDEEESAEAKAARIKELMVWSRRQSMRNLQTIRSRPIQPPAA